MKKFTVLLLLLAMVSALTFGQMRIDAGIAVPIGIGAVLDGTSLEMNDGIGEYLSRTIFPLPEAALHYQLALGNLKMGVGIRAFTLILETIVWPNAFVEYDFGPVVAEAQIGGGAFLLFGLVSDFQTGEVFFPDLSIWMKLGTKQYIRLGAGIMGVYLPEQSSSFPVVVYLGGKITLVSN